MTRISRGMRAQFAREAESLRAARSHVTDEMIDRAAHSIACITHPIFRGADAWECAIPEFKKYWRTLARAALTAALSPAGGRAGEVR